MSDPADYDFRDVATGDLKLLETWLKLPHWREWWDAPEEAIANIRQDMTSDEVEPLIVELDGKPIAYLQTYDPHLEDAHPYQDQPFGTVGVDLSIGPADMLDKGHGSAVLAQFADILFEEGAPRVVIDPDPANKRAIAAYAKAGFQPIGERDTPWGRVLLMALDAPDDMFGE